MTELQLDNLQPRNVVVVVGIIWDMYGSAGVSALRTRPEERTPWQRMTADEIERVVLGPDPRWREAVIDALARS